MFHIGFIYNKICTLQCGTYCYQCGAWLYTIWEEYMYRIGNDHVSLVEYRLFLIIRFFQLRQKDIKSHDTKDIELSKVKK